MQTLLLTVLPEEAFNEEFLKTKISSELEIREEFNFKIVNESESHKVSI